MKMNKKRRKEGRARKGREGEARRGERKSRTTQTNQTEVHKRSKCCHTFPDREVQMFLCSDAEAHFPPDLLSSTGAFPEPRPVLSRGSFPPASLRKSLSKTKDLASQKCDSEHRHITHTHTHTHTHSGS
jgi:hypothetical protein